MRHLPLWDDWHNAEVYREYVERFPIYRALNRRLAELAELGSARRALDLACGGGATAAACLARMPADAELVGVDGAAAMVGVARSRVTDPRATFVRAAAHEVRGVVEGRFDRVVCNAAFWMFPHRERLVGDLAALLEEAGLLVFDVPAQLVAGEPAPPDPFQVALGRALGSGSDGRVSDLPEVETPALAALLDGAGMSLERVERFEHRARLAELVELMRIPAMIGRVAPELSTTDRSRLIDRAAAGADPAAEVRVRWLFYVARRASG